MITIPRYLDRSANPVVRLVGLGNAGVNLADRITMSGLNVDVVAMNSDQQSLSSSVAPVRVALGPLATRGLGAGGDPEIGADAARESQAEIEEALAGADIVFLAAGLGGGTASGAAAAVADAARGAGALLIAMVTSPFAFEGRRRAAQAAAGLADIVARADAVIHFENDRMADLTAPRAGVSETFAACDELLGSCVQAFSRLMAAPGPMSVGLPDLISVLRGGDAECLFGTAEARGDNRAHEALEVALRSPLLDRGRLLDQAGALLIHVSGPPSFSFAEADAVLNGISKHINEETLVHLGVSTVDDPSAPVSLTLIGKCGATARVEPVQRPAARKTAPVEVRPVEPVPAAQPPEPEHQEEFASPEPAPPPRPAVVDRPPPPERPSRVAPDAGKPKPTPPKVRQETLQFEPVARGRFEKSEPTIVEGEDLDVPTFLRRNKKH